MQHANKKGMGIVFIILLELLDENNTFGDKVLNLKRNVKYFLQWHDGIQSRIFGVSINVSDSATEKFFIRWLIGDIYGFVWVHVLSTDQEMTPARNAIGAHAQGFFVNGEWLLAILKVFALPTRLQRATRNAWYLQYVW